MLELLPYILAAQSPILIDWNGMPDQHWTVAISTPAGQLSLRRPGEAGFDRRID
jgi:hypothetical protein